MSSQSMGTTSATKPPTDHRVVSELDTQSTCDMSTVTSVC